jgi:hypothetical protein
MISTASPAGAPAPRSAVDGGGSAQRRARVEDALAHRQPDRLPLDFGSTVTSGIHVSVVAELRRHFGLAEEPVRVVESMQMLGEIAPDLAAALGIDTIGVLPPRSAFGFANRGWKPWRTPWGQEVLVPAGFRVRQRPDGGVLIHPQGDEAAEPSALMPAGGWFFDALHRPAPAPAEPVPEDNSEGFGRLGAEDLEHYRHEVASAHATGRAVVLSGSGTSLGNISHVPGPSLLHPRGIRSIDDWYAATAERPEFIATVFAHQVRVGLANRLHAAVGDAVSAIYLCGTDFGTQRGPICSRRSFQSLYLPYYRELTGWIHAHTRWKVFKHCCGGVRPFLEDFVAAGFDILNPVQCSATGMEAAGLKRDFGERMTFWGGVVDTQRTLPFGTPEEVRREVLERCAVFAPGGGFVVNSIHNVQAGTPLANLVALIEAVREFDRR